MYTQNVTINNEVGLHARPATFFIQKANEFKSGIWLEKDERRVNAKSLLGVLSLGIVKGTTITLLADGADEKGSRDRSVRAGFQQFRRITNNQERRLPQEAAFFPFYRHRSTGYTIIYYNVEMKRKEGMSRDKAGAFGQGERPAARAGSLSDDGQDRLRHLRRQGEKLKNRVSQYFQENSSHNEKTRRMVSQVDHFDTIFVSTEFEALILENCSSSSTCRATISC